MIVKSDASYPEVAVSIATGCCGLIWQCGEKGSLSGHAVAAGYGEPLHSDCKLSVVSVELHLHDITYQPEYAASVPEYARYEVQTVNDNAGVCSLPKQW